MTELRNKVTEEYQAVFDQLGSLRLQARETLLRFADGPFNYINGYQRSSIVSELASMAGGLERIQALLAANRPPFIRTDDEPF